MRRFVFIVALMLSGQTFGQSSLFNVPYRPQPRILIPTVEPSQTLVSTNGTVIANTNRALRYCDFYLAAVDQTGTYTNPILFEFSSVTTNAQSAAVVFFQRSGSNWPSSLLRREGSTYVITNWTTLISTNVTGIYTNWTEVIASNNYPAYVAYKGSNFVYGGSNANVRSKPTFYKNQFTAPAGPFTYYYEYTGTATTWVIYHYSGTNRVTDYTAAAFTNAVVSAPIQTNYWLTTYLTNTTSEMLSANVLSISQTSTNEASAIEVYPVRQGQKWMKQTNPDIKWMCLLSNGKSWYSTPAGDPVWFNCLVEWVDKIPAQGVR
ncbi:MAG: hypothetical protein WCH86_02350 [Kiritimatiellales bacterium]